MRSWHWILACGVTFTAAPVVAQPAKAETPDQAPAAKPDPSAKAARCAGKQGPQPGCTGFKPSTLRLRTEPKPAAKSDGPRTPDLGKDFVEQIRKDAPLQKQSERLLIAEIARLERLLAMTPRKSPDRAQLIRRIADAYAELEARAIHRKLVAEENVRKIEQENAKRPKSK